MEGPEKERWGPLRQALLAVRDAVHAQRTRLTLPVAAHDDARVAESVAVQKVASQPYFAPYRPESRSDQAFGRDLVVAIVELAEELQRERLVEESPASWCTRLWADTLIYGFRPSELARRHGNVHRSGRGAPQSPAAAESRVRGLMWLPGNHPRAAAAAGVERLQRRADLALQRTFSGAVELSAATFSYEWSSLVRFSPEGRLLLAVLAQLAPNSPLSTDVLRAGWEPTPRPLRAILRNPAAMAALVGHLSDAGLLEYDAGTVTLPFSGRDQVLAVLEPRNRRAAAGVAIRLLRESLPPDTHHWASWPIWQDTAVHVEAAVDSAVGQAVRLLDAAWMADRLSVYYRATDTPRRAVPVSERCLEIAEAAVGLEPIDHSTYLTNLGLAQADAGLSDGLSLLERSRDILRTTSGSTNYDFAETSSLYANLLDRAGESRRARQVDGQTIKLLRRLRVIDDSANVRELLGQVLNNAAAHDLSVGKSPKAALHKIEEAETLLGPSDFGWFAVQLTHSSILLRLDDLDAAAELLTAGRGHVRENFGETSLQHLAWLRELADVQKAQGDPQWEQTYLAAHDVDDARDVDGFIW